MRKRAIIWSALFAAELLAVLFRMNISRYYSDLTARLVFGSLLAAVGGIFQFGIAGLGITIVAIVRKERFSDHGLTLKHLLPAIALSALCCVPDLLYNLFAGNVHTWLPFSAVQTTAEAIESGFPENALAMLLTALFWGFFEGFNYVVIFDKIGERYPSKNRLWDWGADPVYLPDHDPAVQKSDLVDPRLPQGHSGEIF